jgi:hypothetical protein
MVISACGALISACGALISASGAVMSAFGVVARALCIAVAAADKVRPSPRRVPSLTGAVGPFHGALSCPKRRVASHGNLVG